MTTSLLVPEIQAHNDKYHGQRIVETFRRIKVHTNEAPPILDVTRRLLRQESSQLKYTNEIIRLDPKEVKQMQTRTADLVLSHVSEILQFLNKEGYDPTELPPCVVKFRGEYYIINGHHQTAALIERGQTLWIYDVYEYIGPDDFSTFEKAVKSLGKKINLVGTTPKHEQKWLDIVNSYIRDVKNNYEKTGIAHLRCDENGNPIPLKAECVDIILEEDGFTARWSPDKSSGKKATYTKTVKKILDWESANIISNIRSFSPARKSEIIKGGMYKDNGKMSDDGRKCYMVCTDNPSADGIKTFIQNISSKSPVRFLNYSGETDDPQKVIDNEKAYLKRGYRAYVDSIDFHNAMVEKYEEERIRNQLKSTPYTYEQWLTTFEWAAVTQLDDEKGNVIKRDVTN